MTPAVTSCIATVTGLCAIVSTRGRAPRCNCLQRSPATEMNSNLLPMFSVEIMPPPRPARVQCSGCILDEKRPPGRAGAFHAGRRCYYGSAPCRWLSLGKAVQLSQNPDHSSLGDQAALLTLGRLAERIVGILSGVFLVRLLSKSDYGTFLQVSLIGSLAASLILLGLPQSLLYFVPREPSRGRRRFIFQTAMITFG